MAGPRRRWLPALTEVVASGEQPEGRRLTHFSQALLATGLLMAGFGIYAGAWEISLRMSSRGELCLRLTPGTGEQIASMGGNQLYGQYRLGLDLIRQLPGATVGQRQRLSNQLGGLVQDVDSFCNLVFYYTNERAALLTLATVSATVMLLIAVVVAPEGIQSISRTQRTTFFTASALLAVTMNFLQLGEQLTNSDQAQSSYHGHAALLQRLNSSLANHSLEEGIDGPGALDALKTSAGVSRLISGIDRQRLSMPDPRLQLSDSVSEQAWRRLLDPSASAPGGATPPSRGQPAALERPR